MKEQSFLSWSLDQIKWLSPEDIGDIFTPKEIEEAEETKDA